jgi:uncharacterized protein with PIN domain
MCVRFFIDNNFGRELARGLRDLGYENVEHLTDHFNEDEKDEVWLKYVGENKLALITKDRKIRANINEKEALRKYKVVAFYLQGDQMGKQDTSLQLMTAWHKMEEKAKVQLKTGVACAFSVNRKGGGKFEVIPLHR